MKDPAEPGTAPAARAQPAAPALAPGPVLAGDPSSAQSEVPPKPSSRAGRNLGAAIAVGIALGAVIIATLLLYRPSFAIVVGVAVVYGCYELSIALRAGGVRVALPPVAAGAVAILAAAWFAGPDGLGGAALAGVAAVLAWCFADGTPDTYVRRAGASAFVLLYVPALGGFAVLSTHASDGAARVLAFAVVVVCNDTGGYATGVLFGRHPLAPIVSKGKTWEGFAGSVAFGVAAGILLLTLTFHQAWWKGAVFGFALVVTATVGDLGESMIKRDIGVKDMGALLPGHGGVMDRLDSMLPCAAVGYLLLTLFAPA
jgi:phosphatidate cytidylyltransferase